MGYEVMRYDGGSLVPYDVIGSLVTAYRTTREPPGTEDEFRRFVARMASILWREKPVAVMRGDGRHEELDIYRQVMMNVDVVARLLQEAV